jgi:putative membrane protein
MDTPLVDGPARTHPKAVTTLLSVIGYAAVVGAFVVPSVQALFPRLSLAQVNVLADAIAVVNSISVVLLCLGWYWIRSGEVEKHAHAMVSSFVLILIFLGMYLPKVAGGGTKEFVLESAYSWVPLWDWVYPAYLLMLAVHILLSILAVPLVIYAIVLGLTHTPEELRTETPHKRVGRIAAGTWILSLSLGVVTYLLLNHLYAWEFVAA